MKRILTLCAFIAAANFAAGTTIFGTYNKDTADGSATTTGGSILDAYTMTSTASTYSLLTFTPNAGQDFTFSGITDLSLAYNAVAGGIAGGSPRIEVDFTNNTSLLALLGPAGTFVNPTLGNGNSGNLVTQDDTGRYDLSQGGLGGSGYTNYDAALASAGNLQVSSLTIILDAGWAVSGGLQQFDLSANPLTVQANLATPEPTSTLLIGFGLITVVLIRRRTV